MEGETTGVNDDFMQFHLFQSPGHHYILTYSELVFTKENYNTISSYEIKYSRMNKVKFVEGSLEEYGLL